VAVVTKLHAAIQTVIGDKSLQQTLAKEGLELRGSASPEGFASFQKKEFEENAAIIREAGLAPS
jgi:tripartite-type tricarboxylate transporter receptor subunit TctC